MGQRAAPVAQGIEHRPPESGAQVRFLPGVPTPARPIQRLRDQHAETVQPRTAEWEVEVAAEGDTAAGGVLRSREGRPSMMTSESHRCWFANVAQLNTPTKLKCAGLAGTDSAPADTSRPCTSYAPPPTRSFRRFKRQGQGSNPHATCPNRRGHARPSEVWYAPTAPSEPWRRPVGPAALKRASRGNSPADTIRLRPWSSADRARASAGAPASSRRPPFPSVRSAPRRSAWRGELPDETTGVVPALPLCRLPNRWSALVIEGSGS